MILNGDVRECAAGAGVALGKGGARSRPAPLEAGLGGSFGGTGAGCLNEYLLFPSIRFRKEPVLSLPYPCVLPCSFLLVLDSALGRCRLLCLVLGLEQSTCHIVKVLTTYLWHEGGSHYTHGFEIPLCVCLVSWFEINETVRKIIFHLNFILPAKACGVLTCMFCWS